MTDDSFDETLNMSMRKFLKRVGVTSQQAIEDAVRAQNPAPGAMTAKVTLTVEGLELTHEIDGEIRIGESS